jgi:hypothetical protein
MHKMHTKLVKVIKMRKKQLKCVKNWAERRKIPLKCGKSFKRYKIHKNVEKITKMRINRSNKQILHII